MTSSTKESVAILAIGVRNGDQEAFRELEEVARPLLISLSNKFTGYHDKFDFDDFYSIGLYATYKACLSFGDGNPSFLSYAKIFILRAMWHEIDYWNQGKRNIFEVTEDEIKDSIDSMYFTDMTQIIFIKDFRKQIDTIINECFDEKKSNILRMYIFDDARVSDIASVTKLDYKYVYQVVSRGTKRLEEEYSNRFLDIGEVL